MKVKSKHSNISFRRCFALFHSIRLSFFSRKLSVARICTCASNCH